MAGQTDVDRARERDNAAREKKGEAAETKVAVVDRMEKTDLGAAARANAKAAAEASPAGVKTMPKMAVDDDEPPKQRPNEPLGDFSARVREYRQRKQAGQTRAFEKMK